MLRCAIWGAAAGLVIDDVARFQRMFGRLDGAPQQCALAGSILVELVGAYIVARAADRILALSPWSKPNAA